MPEILESDDFTKIYLQMFREAIAKAKTSFLRNDIPFSVEDHLALVERCFDAVLGSGWCASVGKQVSDCSDEAAEDQAAPTDEFTHQLVIQIPVDSDKDFERFTTLEDRVINCLESAPCDVEGNDLGSGTGNIFIDTNDPLETFGRLRKGLRLKRYLGLKVAYRPQDSDEFTLLWPENSEEAFKLI